MPSVTETLQLPVSASHVWGLIGDFNGLDRWHPAVEASQLEGEGIGSVRTMNVVGGVKIVEELKDYQDGASYSYSILEGPIPVKDYLSKLSVSADVAGTGSVVTWEGTFEADDVPDEIAETAIRDIYLSGLIALEKHFGEG